MLSQLPPFLSNNILQHPWAIKFHLECLQLRFQISIHQCLLSFLVDFSSPSNLNSDERTAYLLGTPWFIKARSTNVLSMKEGFFIFPKMLLVEEFSVILLLA
ncbi:hypothetical protein V8G54_020258 [Vigna mungo]|uniref:Uncharacterized protein n=1 Tax=Vigna mungo TaxID=3915 RepID=A0AAQ3NBX9_VIGMU